MAFSGTTYTEIEAARAEVAVIIARKRRHLDDLKASFSTIVTEMTVSGTEYGPIVTLSAALLATDPTNTAFIVLNASIGKHLADFNSLSAEASALDVLVNT